MSKYSSQFVGSIPGHYEDGLGPHIFVDYAREMAERVASLEPRRLLELAAGTGIVTRALRQALPASTHITATDLNPPMLDVAREKLADAANLAFEPADATALPFDDASFDAIVCQFGVMFFPDKDQHYREVYRVLRPGGRYLFSVWDSFDHNPFARIAHETIGSFFSSDPPAFYQVPFSYRALDPIKASLEGAAFRGVGFELIGIEKEIPDATLFARGLVYGNPAIDEIRSRGSAGPEAVTAALADALRAEFGEDPGRMSLQAIVVSAAKPVA